MKSSQIFLLASEYFILNKDLIKKIGLEATTTLCSLAQIEMNNNMKKNFFTTTIAVLMDDTSLSEFKIKNAINKLYKMNIIDVVVKKNDIDVKIMHDNIFPHINMKNKSVEKKKNQSRTKMPNKRFKKPTKKALSNYFKELGSSQEESEIMFDYYESKGWKVGKSPMKCWKSASRNWVRRENKKTDFPNYYDKSFESKICDDPLKLSKYHNHLKNIGWESTYSPSSGSIWKQIKK